MENQQPRSWTIRHITVTLEFLKFWNLFGVSMPTTIDAYVPVADMIVFAILRAHFVVRFMF